MSKTRSIFCAIFLQIKYQSVKAKKPSHNAHIERSERGRTYLYVLSVTVIISVNVSVSVSVSVYAGFSAECPQDCPVDCPQDTEQGEDFHKHFRLYRANIRRLSLFSRFLSISCSRLVQGWFKNRFRILLGTVLYLYCGMSYGLSCGMSRGLSVGQKEKPQL